jgi:hypothetical protein
MSTVYTGGEIPPRDSLSMTLESIAQPGDDAAVSLTDMTG